MKESVRDGFPVVDAAGSPYDVGLAHGRHARDQVERSITTYGKLFRTEGNLERSDLRAMAAELREAVAAHAPDRHAEMEGIAEGSGCDVLDVVALNYRTEILWSRSGPSKLGGDGCSVVAWLPPGGEPGVLVGKNWDWMDDIRRSIIVLRGRPEGAPAFLMVVEAGMVGRDGFSANGIAVVGNGLLSTEDGTEDARINLGAPIPAVRRQVLESANLGDAVDAVMFSKRAASGNYLLADADGMAIDLEVTPSRVFPITPTGSLLTHANHFESPAADCLDVAGYWRYWTGDSLYRSARLRHLLDGGHRPSVARLQEALRDHLGHPRSLCRHANPSEETRILTMASMVFDLGARCLYVSNGPPCEHDYQRIDLDPVSPPVTLPGSLEESA